MEYFLREVISNRFLQDHTTYVDASDQCTHAESPRPTV